MAVCCVHGHACPFDPQIHLQYFVQLLLSHGARPDTKNTHDGMFCSMLNCLSTPLILRGVSSRALYVQAAVGSTIVCC